MAIASLASLAVAVHAELPMIGESVRSFPRLQWPPVVFAVLAETGSMIALALMERRILILAGQPAAGRAGDRDRLREQRAGAVTRR